MGDTSANPGGAVRGGLGFISKYLTVWILLAMAAGIVLGNVYPDIVPILDSVRVEEVSLPIAIGLIWMMYPPLAAVKYEELARLRRQGNALSLSLVDEMPPADRVVLVSVVEEGETKSEIEAAVKRATQALSALRDRLKSSGCDAVFHVHAGDPATEISRVAGEEDLSLVVMDARGESGPGRVRIAGATENVIRTTDRPVLLIR
jgi:nucleotide-binding universal stress UspA family protein